MYSCHRVGEPTVSHHDISPATATPYGLVVKYSNTQSSGHYQQCRVYPWGFHFGSRRSECHRSDAAGQRIIRAAAFDSLTAARAVD
jgi:hypothetical protein